VTRQVVIPSLAAALALCAGTCALASQPVMPTPDAQTGRVAPTPILDGSSFAGLALTTDPQPGNAQLSALRATVWSTGDAQRAVLDGDVTLNVGGYSLRADRASVWIETLYPSDGRRLRQIAVYLDNARDPLASAGSVVRADRLLVTVVVTGDVLMSADAFQRGRPTDAEFVVESERRLARFLIDNLAIAQAGEGAPLLQPIDEDLRIPPSALRDVYATADEIEAAIPGPDGRLPPASGGEFRPARQGVVSFSAPDIALLSEPDERVVVLAGGVALQQVDASDGRTVQLTATRAVVFLEPDDLLAASTPTDAVRGVYLEGDVVATDGSYTLRGAQVYYDPQTQKAMLVDAVFWTYDEARGIPIYARAKTIRQESERQWTAKDVRLSNAAFAEPTLSIGARSVTVTRVERGERATLRAGEGGLAFDADGTRVGGVLIDADAATFRVGTAPVLPLPRYRGDLTNPPLRRLQFDSRAGSPAIRTTWDFETLANLDFGPGFNAELILDGYLERGPAIGLDAEWSTPESFGEFFGYLVYDEGEDRFATGQENDRDGDLRGVATFEHALRLNTDWTLFVDAAYTSDPAFIAAFFPGIAESAREFSSGVALRRVRDNEFFLAQVRGALQDWVPNEYLLQSPGTITERLPELTYARVADGLFDGAVTYSSETSAGLVALRFVDIRPEEIGYDTNSLAQRAFGIGPFDSLADRLRAQGLDEEGVARFDTRHEVSLPIGNDLLRVVPFAVGRFTAYDDDFSEFDNNAEDMRLYGAGGVRLATTIQRIDDAVSNSALDLHRMRHLIEPSVTIWHAESNSPQGAYPIYDTRTEGVNTGTAMRAGVKQTWQTYRGGPGRWYSVDWLMVNLDYVWSSGDVDRTSPIGRWVESRPEYSVLGDYFTGDALWQATDALAFTGFAVYDTEEADLATAAVGTLFDVTPDLRGFTELRHIDSVDSTLVDFGADWLMSAKYSLGALAVVDLDESRMQSIGVEIERRFAQVRVNLALAYDDISNDASIGIALQPLAARGANRARSPIGSTVLPGDVIGRRSGTPGGPFGSN
jgi:hypothetical protein